MRRSVATWCLCVLALLSGLRTAVLSAANRQRGDELDQLERWCEAQSRSNDLQRVENARQEWRLLGQQGAFVPGAERAAVGKSARATP